MKGKMKGKMKGTEEERENSSEGQYQTLSSAASRPHYAYECKFPFASLRAGIYLSRTRSRIQSRTVWYIHESPFLHVVPDFQFLFLLGHLRSCCYPPLANPSASFSLWISERPCILPQLSATVISRGYFCLGLHRHHCMLLLLLFY